jgi:hypothetical protein
MEGWRQWLTRPEKTLVQKNKITHLTPTGLLMEGDDIHRLERGASSRLLARQHLQTVSKTPVGPDYQCHGAGSLPCLSRQ